MDGSPEAGHHASLLSGVDLHKEYARRVWPRRRTFPVLSGATLAVSPGEVVGLVGENGSGKTTMMRILVGDLQPGSGNVQRTGQLGYCPQVPQLYARLTCDEHFELFAAAYRLDGATATRSRDKLYDQLDFPRYAESRAGELSGGTLAKLNLALALLPDPPILVLDEPYAGFDWDTYLRFWGIVESLRAHEHAVLIVSHFAADQERFDRLVHLRNGRTGPT
jgi:ABC-2 type transport system ATP-binding protein